MRHRNVIIFLAAAVLAASIPGWAQDPPGAFPARRNVRENLVTLRLLRMTAALDLTESQTAIIFPSLNRIEKDKLKVQTAMSADLRDLRVLVHNPEAREADILARVRSVLDARHKVRCLNDEVDQLLEKHLTVVQRGKYVLFQVEFYRGLGDTLDLIRQRRGQFGPPMIKK